MCVGCWSEYGAPKIDNQAVRDAAELVDLLYNYHYAGGRLHIVTDDFNIEDENLAYCAEKIATASMEEFETMESREIERKCCEALMRLTLEERASALALHDGYWK